MSWSYRPALDGLRCVAVYLVLLFHAGLSAVDGGFIGVDIFFVLSGFLISNVIFSEIDRSGTLRLGHFYARRVRRLLPAAVVTIVVTSIVFMLIVPTAARLPFVRDAQSALLYFANWHFLFQSNDYFGAAIDKSPFLHFWSLSVEEQFYFVFPALLLVVTRLAQRLRWVLPVVLSALLVLSVGAQLYWAPININHAYYGTDARFYQLMAGALLAVVLRRRPASLGPRIAVPLAVIGMTGLIVIGSGLVNVTPSVRGLAAAALSVATIAGLMAPINGGLARLLSLPLPVYLGRISYGTYLWHWPVMLALLTMLDTRPVVIAALAAGLGTALAALSYQVLEMPIRQSNILGQFRWGTIIAGLATSVVVAITAIPTVLTRANQPALITATGTASSSILMLPEMGLDQNTPVPPDIDWQEVADDRGPPDLFCTPSDLISCVVVKGSGPHITLVGDSNARMLAPMFIKLAKEHDFTLSLNIVIACSWQAGVKNLRWPAKEQKRCDAARADWYKNVLPKLGTDIVVLVQKPRDNAWWRDKFGASDGSKDSLAELNLRTMTQTLHEIRAAGARALIIDSIMGSGELDPADCLSGTHNANDCLVMVPIEKPLSDAFYRTLAVRYANVYELNINPVICPRAPVCQTIIDGIVVWRNKHHLTATFATHVHDKVWKRLVDTGVLHNLATR